MGRAANHLWRRGTRWWWRRRLQIPRNSLHFSAFFGPAGAKGGGDSGKLPGISRDLEKNSTESGPGKNSLISVSRLKACARAQGAPTQLALSLGTGCPDAARRRARRLDALFDHAMELRRGMTALTRIPDPAKALAAADAGLRARLAAQTAVYARIAAAYPPDDPRRAIAEARADEEAAREIELLYHHGAADAAASPAEDVDVPAEPAPNPASAPAAADAPRAAPARAPGAAPGVVPGAAAESAIAPAPTRPGGAHAAAARPDDGPPEDGAPRPGLARAQTQAAPPVAPRTPPRFSEAAARFLARKVEERGRSYRENSSDNVKATVRLVLEAFGDLRVDAFTEEHMRQLTSILRSTPYLRGKGRNDPPLFDHIALAEAKRDEAAAWAEEMKAQGLPRGDIETRVARLLKRWRPLAPPTIWRKQQEVLAIFELCREQGEILVNPMRTVIWSKKQMKALKREHADNARLPWGDKIVELFTSTIFTSRLDDPGEPLFWAPLIGFLMGMRMEEILQLKLGDLETEGGVPIIRVRRGDGQHVKSEAGRRRVPIHPALIELGLLELVALRRREGREWLFPHLERSAQRGRLSGPFSKRFTNYRVKEGIYDELRDFHSLRADCNIRMKHAGVPLDARKRLLGHAYDDVTDVDYDKEGYPIQTLRDFIARIRLDIGGVVRPFGGGTGASAASRFRIVS